MKKLSAVLLFSAVFAQPCGGQGGPGGPGGPGGTPPFVTACKGKAEGASCSFTDDRANKTYQGQCKKMKKPGGTEYELICDSEEFKKNMPAHGGQNRGNGQ